LGVGSQNLSPRVSQNHSPRSTAAQR
jgi:hypothetical protein